MGWIKRHSLAHVDANLAGGDAVPTPKVPDLVAMPLGDSFPRAVQSGEAPTDCSAFGKPLDKIINNVEESSACGVVIEEGDAGGGALVQTRARRARKVLPPYLFAILKVNCVIRAQTKEIDWGRDGVLAAEANVGLNRGSNQY